MFIITFNNILSTRMTARTSINFYWCIFINLFIMAQKKSWLDRIYVHLGFYCEPSEPHLKPIKVSLLKIHFLPQELSDCALYLSFAILHVPNNHNSNYAFFLFINNTCFELNLNRTSLELNWSH